MVAYFIFGERIVQYDSFLILLCRCMMNAHSFETPHSFLLCQSTGDQALELLQHLCANDLDVPVGHIVHTGMLNAKGGYENDCSVVRLSKNRSVTPPPTAECDCRKQTQRLVLSAQLLHRLAD